MTTTEYWSDILLVIYPAVGVIEFVLFLVTTCHTVATLETDEELSKRCKGAWIIFAILGLFLIFLYPIVSRL